MTNGSTWCAWRRGWGARHAIPATDAGAPQRGDLGYDAYRERKARESREQSLAGREIGPLPEVADPERKRACARDFRAFCERYFPATFHLAWSDDHLKVIAKIERAVLEGGLFLMAMPRGSGKTSLCETACLWALLYGHREFVTLVGADEAHAEQMLDAIKAELENSDDLLGDFPEVCAPIRALEGIHQRAAGQLHEGKQTHIGWTAREIVLPSIEGSAASGSLIRVAGITGRIRGMKHKRADGSSVRPSLVLIDDPQTDESARSPSQCANRERILAGAILGLAGPGSKIAGLMPVTVVRPDDLADRLLDREKHPAWQGERTKMVYEFPKSDALWSRYAQLRAEGLRAERGLIDATAFYKEHRAEMDERAVPAWQARYEKGELSTIQHAMNIRLDRGDSAFFAEYQNEPLPEEAAEAPLDADAIVSRLNGRGRGVVPAWTSAITAFIDVQGSLLYYVVAAFGDDFAGAVVDYGAEPEQRQGYFTLTSATRTLRRAAPGAGEEGAITAGLARLAERLLELEWKIDGGGVGTVDRCLIDANWGKSTDLVYEFCRSSSHRAVLTPSHGRNVGASSVSMDPRARKKGERVGLNWRMPAPNRGRAVRHITYDTNFWKSFLVSRFKTEPGDPGGLSLFGDIPDRHRMFADHVEAEHAVRTEARGRTVDEWRAIPGRDNHLFDCVVGACVAASVCGVTLPGTTPARARRSGRRRVKFSEMRGRAGQKSM